MKYEDAIKYQIGDTFEITEFYPLKKFDTVTVTKIDKDDPLHPIEVMGEKLGQVWLNLSKYNIWIEPVPEPEVFIDPNVLHIWTLGLGWRGCVIVVAKTREQAKAKMRDYYNVEEDDLKNIEHHEINEDFEYCDLGDM